jgi:hypothetical protein
MYLFGSMNATSCALDLALAWRSFDAEITVMAFQVYKSVSSKGEKKSCH